MTRPLPFPYRISTSASTGRCARAWLLGLVPFLLLACTTPERSAAPGARKAPAAGEAAGPAAVYSLELTPPDPTRNSILSLTPKGFNLIDARIIWMVNGSIDPEASTSRYQATDARRGDSIQAKAVLKDAEVLSNSVTIKNTPPAISQARFILDTFNTGNRLGVEATGTDPDGDAVTFLYEWTLNNEPAGKGQYLDSALKRGDKVAVSITPYDGTDYGVPVAVQKEFLNIPPIITPHKEFTFDGSVYTYQVKASDSGGDALTYAVESPPDGMTIDPSTGLIKWNVPKDFKGTKTISIVVRDGHGGVASYSYPITIQE